MDTTQALVEAVGATFADLAFLDTERVSRSPDKPRPGQVVAVEFLRPLAGYLALHLSRHTKQAIIENIHGVHWKSLSGSEIDDCLMELVNIMAGTFLILVGADRHALSLPLVLYDQSDLMIEEEPLDYFFSVNDEIIKASLKYTSPSTACEKEKELNYEDARQ